MTSDRTVSRRRWLRGCGSLSVVGLAGCLSDSTDGSDSPEESDREPADIDFPPGLSDAGIDDAEMLFDAHSDVVTSTSFASEYTARTRWTDESTEQWRTVSSESFAVRAEPDAERVEKIADDGRAGRETDHRIYIDGDRGATSDDGRLTHRTAAGVLEMSLETIGHWVRNVDGDYDGPETIEAGSVHAVQVTEIDTQRPRGDSIDETGTILVGEDGRIHRFRIRKTVERADERAALEVEFEYDGFGATTVDEPEWVDDLEDTGHERVEIEPGTRIELSAQTVAWVGVAPAGIADLENPTLVLESGESYEIGWSEGNGMPHNIQLRDGNGDVVDDHETDVVTESAAGQWIEFTASEELAAYACEPHQSTMNGDIEVR
ncbi:DUF7537 family lipoprotein [Natrinema amylolyticum]|uniref:DUF7537 family lipoprotein n=1 Tax=Natrinema amylolyticum TaxID=2878679 RepID=UPI001CFA84AA|nr:plastocyanin/azurin family copper-binding protein [Natrinema amylolyticum]